MKNETIAFSLFTGGPSGWCCYFRSVPSHLGGSLRALYPHRGQVSRKHILGSNRWRPMHYFSFVFQMGSMDQRGPTHEVQQQWSDVSGKPPCESVLLQASLWIWHDLHKHTLENPKFHKILADCPLFSVISVDFKLKVIKLLAARETICLAPLW